MRRSSLHPLMSFTLCSLLGALGPQAAAADAAFGALFVRGDANADGVVDIADASTTLAALFLTTEVLPCEDAADANDDGAVDLSDAVETLTRLFLGSRGQHQDKCTFDPSEDVLACARSSCDAPVIRTYGIRASGIVCATVPCPYYRLVPPERSEEEPEGKPEDKEEAGTLEKRRLELQLRLTLDRGILVSAIADDFLCPDVGRRRTLNGCRAWEGFVTNDPRFPFGSVFVRLACAEAKAEERP